MGCCHVREDPVSSLSAVVVTGASSAIRASYCRAVAMTVLAASVTSGGTVKLQGCNTASTDDNDWWDLDSVAVSANGTTEVLAEFPPPFVRSNVTARTDGTFTTTIAKIGSAGHGA